MQLKLDSILTRDGITKSSKINRFTSEFYTTLASTSSWPVANENGQQYVLGTLQMPDNNSLKIKLGMNELSFPKNTGFGLWIEVEGKKIYFLSEFGVFILVCSLNFLQYNVLYNKTW